MRFLQALESFERNKRMAVIPDIKCRSPKEGELLAGRDPVRLAHVFADAGAPALSVVTEKKSFGGSLSMLSRIAESTGLPVLRKDFIRTVRQVGASAEAGASAVLLIVSMLGKERLGALLEACAAEGLDALVEVHTSEEINAAAAFEPALIGINNRDILRLECDGGTVRTTAELASLIPYKPYIVSESGIAAQDEAQSAAKAGARAILVGTALLKAADAAETYRKLSVNLP
jgi:indole-3-glycerol phosphate synthase